MRILKDEPLNALAFIFIPSLYLRIPIHLASLWRFSHLKLEKAATG
jgi:hypothetical protein